jgi:hypothetical protein
MPERVREVMAIHPREEQCRQPIIGGGWCLLPADTAWYHIEAE